MESLHREVGSMRQDFCGLDLCLHIIWLLSVSMYAVPCGRDAFLACDSEWTYCLQQNKTRRASCVASCFVQNGNCDSDSICITKVPENDGTPRLQCVKSDGRSHGHH